MLTRITTRLVSSLGLALLLGHSSVSAALVEVGAPVLFNFKIPDLQTAFRPMIYYGIMECLARGDAPGQGAPVCAGTVQVFKQVGGVDLAPSLSTSWMEGQFPYASFSDVHDPGIQGLLDGELSILYTSTVGAIEAVPYLMWEVAFDAYVRVDAFSVSAVPEPGSVALLALGLAGLGATRYRSSVRSRV